MLVQNAVCSPPSDSTKVLRTFSYNFIANFRETSLLFLATMMDALFSIPMLSVFLIPVISSYSTSLNLLFFYMTWTTLVLSHTPLRVELFGTIAVRVLFYALPSIVFFLFDILTPSASVVIKAQGATGLPGGKRRRSIRQRELKIAGWALVNLSLAIAVQWAIETACVRGLGLRSALKVSLKLPMPYEMCRDLVVGMLGREVRLSSRVIFPPNLLTLCAFTGPRIWHSSLCSPFEEIGPRQIPPVLVSSNPRSIPTDRALRSSDHLPDIEFYPYLRAGCALPISHAHLSLVLGDCFCGGDLRLFWIYRYADKLLLGWYCPPHGYACVDVCRGELWSLGNHGLALQNQCW